VSIAGALPADARLRLLVSGPDFDDPDKISQTTILVDLAAAGDGAARLERGGLMVKPAEGELTPIDEPMAGSDFFTKFQIFDFYGDKPVVIERAEIPAERIAKEIFYIPGLLLLALVVWLQLRRREPDPEPEAVAAGA
ncbi:MAG: DUF3394 domain-containing protein, partial [Burkholderiaceae bacterium]